MNEKITKEKRKKLLKKIKRIALIDSTIWEKEFVNKQRSLSVTINCRLFSGETSLWIDVKEDQGKFYLVVSYPFFPLFLINSKNSNGKLAEYLKRKIEWLFPEIEVEDVTLRGNEKEEKIKIIKEIRTEIDEKTVEKKFHEITNLMFLLDGFLSGLSPRFDEFEVTKEELIETILDVESQGNAFEMHEEDYLEEVKKELERLSFAELVNYLEKAVERYCFYREENGNTTYDSMALSAFRNGILLLSRLGKIRIEHFTGRRVIGKKVKNHEVQSRKENGKFKKIRL